MMCKPLHVRVQNVLLAMEHPFTALHVATLLESDWSQQKDAVAADEDPPLAETAGVPIEPPILLALVQVMHV
jgi:hypothetical protein